MPNAKEAPYSVVQRYITTEQKQVYRDACAVIEQLGTNLKYADPYISLTGDATYENVTVRLPRLDLLTVARFTATGGMVERFRTGMWVIRLHNLARDANDIASRKTADLADLNALRFEPVDDTEAMTETALLADFRECEKYDTINITIKP